MRTLGALLPLSAVLTLAPAAPAGGRASTAPTSFDASATGYAFDLTVSNASIPVTPTLQVAGPTASALNGSLQGTAAFASFPYPGEVVVGVPGLIAGLYGFPVPAYPAYASSQGGGAPVDQNMPGLQLRAESGDAVTQARAVVGPGQLIANARVAVDDATVTATGEAAGSLTFGGLLSVSGTSSSASATLGPSGEVEVTSDLRIASIVVPGLRLTVPETTPPAFPVPNPIPALPQPEPLEFPPVPLPFGGETLEEPRLGFDNGDFTVSLPAPGGQQSFALPAEAALAALRAAGFTSTYQAAQPIVDDDGAIIGVIAPVMTFETTLPAPPENQGLNGPTTTRIDIGRASAVIDPSAGRPPIAGSDGVAGGPATGVVSGGPVIDSSVGAPGGSASGPTAGAGQSSTSAPATPAFTRLPLGRDALGIYLALVATSLVGLGSAGALRTVGIRNRWTLNR